MNPTNPTNPAPLSDDDVSAFVRKYRRYDAVNNITADQARELLADLRLIVPDWLAHRDLAKVATGPKPAAKPAKSAPVAE